ncbi:MAG: hypothetical protein QHH18_03635 [Candidatus Bathyarchaeota archaeon]|jgi:uncharacterized protein YfaS (alpha-2-macroglobulin family)|nr:hypothetical protein [Candidatus Bathyarchaeota archaeon A05DMB-5]MDH7557683.1 hypothetical protein [Candidatus Bathyarchaeota archaeon]
MNSRREIIIAAILAILLGTGLGAISYSYFAEMPSSKAPITILDVYTQKGGLGANESGGVFEPFDTINLYARLADESAAIKSAQVTFSLKNPENTEISENSLTDDSGIAKINFTLSSERFISGIWQVSAYANVDGAVVKDFLSFNCQPFNTQINVYVKREDAINAVFLPKDNVAVEAVLSYRDNPINDAQVMFEVRFPNNTVLLSQFSLTNNLGIASVAFQIPWPSENALGTWHVTVESIVYQQPITATVDFECQLLPMVLDVYTQKGGLGQNEPSGSFILNETVYLYAEIRNPLNETVPGKLVSFEVRGPNGTITLLFVESTNSSGIATALFRIPPVEDSIGIWEVYARAEFADTVVLDTVTFRCDNA